MSQNPDHKPIFFATHSRSCSTVVERVFWTKPNEIKCYHEHFGDAYYFGPEKISEYWKGWPAWKIPSTGLGEVTYRMSLQDILRQDHGNRQVLNKDMSYHIVPPADSKVQEIPSLLEWDDAAASERHNPTWLPTSAVHAFQFAFLVRSPWLAVPSLYRLHVPPRVHDTLLPEFRPTEIGYRELRILIEYLYPQSNSPERLRNGFSGAANEQLPIVMDATDILSKPEEMLAEFAQRVGLPFDSSMLTWEQHNPEMEKAFNKFRGYHNDAIHSSGLMSQTTDEQERDAAQNRGNGDSQKREQDESGMEMSEDEYMSEWTARFGGDAAKKIKEAVYRCKDDYAWLRQFIFTV